MKFDPKSDLKRELAEMAVSDDQAFVEWLSLAARLSALGDETELKRWRGLLKELGPDINLEKILCDRAMEGVEELEDCTGEDLALAIVAAQDFHCMLESPEGEILPDRARRAIRAWALDTSDVALDTEAAERLEHWLRIFPIAEERRLPVVAIPITVIESHLLAALAPPVETTTFSWPASVGAEVEERMSELVLLDDASPSGSLRRSWQRSFEHDLEGGERMEIARSLNESWEVVIDVESPESVEFVRLGTVAATRVDDDPTRWVIDLAAMPASKRSEILAAPLAVLLSVTRRIVLT